MKTERNLQHRDQQLVSQNSSTIFETTYCCTTIPTHYNSQCYNIWGSVMPAVEKPEGQTNGSLPHLKACSTQKKPQFCSHGKGDELSLYSISRSFWDGESSSRDQKDVVLGDHCRRWYAEYHFVKPYMLLSAGYSKHWYLVLVLWIDIYCFERKGYLCWKDPLFHKLKLKLIF